MKILYLITQSELGGAQRYISDLASHFQKEHDILVCFAKEENSWLLDNLKKNNIKTKTIKNLKRDISPLNDLKALFQIRKIIKNFKPDIIHLNSTKISILGSLASKMFFKKQNIVYTAHGWVFNEKLSNFKKGLYVFLEKYTAILKDKIICVSDYDKNTALGIGIKEKKLKTIHNGIHKQSFLSKELARKRISEMSNMSITDNDFLLGSIGNLYKNKGFGYLINSVKKVLPENINIKLFIIGEGEEKKKLDKIIKEEKLENNIFLLGTIKNASSLLKAFDLYINSSIKEGLSYTILEAMQAQIPIIVTNVGGNSEMIENNMNGIIVKSKNVEEISDKLIYLFKNKIKADLLSLNSIEKLEHFSIEEMLKKTSQIYDSLTQK